MESCPETEQCSSSSNPDKGKQTIFAIRVSKVVIAVMLNANNHVPTPINLSNQVLSLLGFVGKHPLNVLVESRCSTNFVSTTLVSKLRLPIQQSVEAFQVELADGSFLQCNKKSWLYQYDPIINFRDHSIRLYHDNQELELRGLFKTQPIIMNAVADALSSMPKATNFSISGVQMEIPACFKNEYLIDKDFGDAFRAFKSLDPTPAEINMFTSYTVMDELLYYLDCICVPHNGALQKILIQINHEVLFAAHLGINKTYRLLSATYFWPQMQQDVIKYVKGCHSCQIMKASKQLPQGLLQLLPVPKERWESISMDFITTLPRTTKGNAQILVIVDRFSKMTHFIPCKKATSAPNIASLFVQHIFRIHGLPRSIISDRDPKFTGHFWTSLFKSLGTNLLFSSAYHPQMDGQTERGNQILEEMLRHYIQIRLSSWEEYMPLVEFAYNNGPHSIIGTITGTLYLYMKSIERAHTPKELWERVKLPRNYAKALEIIDKYLEYWPKFLVHKNKQRLTKMTQYLIGKRKLALKVREKLVTMPAKQVKREARREAKAEVAAVLDKAIEKELLQRLQSGTYGDIYNFPVKEYQQALDMEELEEEQEEEEEPAVEYVEYEMEDEEELEDFLPLEQHAGELSSMQEDEGVEDDLEDADKTSDKLKAGKRNTLSDTFPKNKKQRAHVEIEYEGEPEDMQQRLL
ncbi:hypothetical protein L7F22_030369 [Adiantum nelumboides]|nr:hypothetical protein [Adiantum nelumboides]